MSKDKRESKRIAGIRSIGNASCQSSVTPDGRRTLPRTRRNVRIFTDSSGKRSYHSAASRNQKKHPPRRHGDTEKTQKQESTVKVKPQHEGHRETSTNRRAEDTEQKFFAAWHEFDC